MRGLGFNALPRYEDQMVDAPVGPMTIQGLADYGTGVGRNTPHRAFTPLGGTLGAGLAEWHDAAPPAATGGAPGQSQDTAPPVYDGPLTDDGRSGTTDPPPPGTVLPPDGSPPGRGGSPGTYRPLGTQGKPGGLAGPGAFRSPKQQPSGTDVFTSLGILPPSAHWTSASPSVPSASMPLSGLSLLPVRR